MTEFNTGLPSTRKLQQIIKEKHQIEVKLLNTDILTGTVVWQDSDYICVGNESQEQIMIRRAAIAYIKPKNS
ncbi:MAG: RNA-binding protein hfq [Okeania sp. SIO2D1]|nr:RNA-binding protein hfq [Okeania sp. SIO2D1]